MKIRHESQTVRFFFRSGKSNAPSAEFEDSLYGKRVDLEVSGILSVVAMLLHRHSDCPVSRLAILTNDIGIFLRKDREIKDNMRLGAISLEELNADLFHYPEGSGFKVLKPGLTSYDMCVRGVERCEDLPDYPRYI